MRLFDLPPWGGVFYALRTWFAEWREARNAVRTRARWSKGNRR